VEWLASTGATKVAIHLDVDAIDSDEVALGLGKEPGGLSREQVRRVIADVSTVSDVVGLTIAEFIPRDVLAIQGLLRGLPLIPVDPDAG
jgi:arginase